MNKAFVINLETHEANFTEVQQTMFPYGLECERFVVTPDEHKQIGCTMSHLELIARAKNEGWPYLIVLEDDCMTCDAMKTWPLIFQYLLQEKNRWDIFLGGAMYVHPKKLQLDFKNLPSKSTNAANNSVALGLLASSTNDALRCCAPSTPCSSQASAILKASSKSQEAIKVEIIECMHAVAAHFIVYNESSYDRFLQWYDFLEPIEKRPNIDNLYDQFQLRTWLASPFLAWQKPRPGNDFTRPLQHAEEKLYHFSQSMRGCLKYRLLGRWLKTIQ